MFDKHPSSVSRVSRDGTKIILLSEGKYYVYTKSTNSVSAPQNNLKSIVAGGQWRRPTLDETAFEPLEFPSITEEEAAEILADEENDPDGDSQETYEFNQDYDFYAVPVEEGSENVNDLYALDPEDEETLYHWEDGEFKDATETEFDSHDMTQWILIDSDTAQYIADWMDHRPEGEESISIFANDPEEKAMFDAAESEMDWEFLSTLSSIIADASGYSPVERSRNAQKQRRGPGGRFAQTPGKSSAEPANDETRAPHIKKTYIPVKREIVLINNPLNFIVEAVGKMSPTGAPSLGGVLTADASPDGPLPEVGQKAQEDTREETTPSADVVYFAIVHRDDNKAVQDLIAITKSTEGSPQAWKRTGKDWKLAPEILADLQSVTPPPVVELDEETAQEVMNGIDQYESNTPTEEESVQASALQENIQKGYALHDGTFLIRDVNDLFASIQLAPEDTSLNIKQHIVKRARALNRIDVVPEEWRSLSIVDQSPLFNSYGEVIVAAGKRGNRGNEETLKRYWTTGKGGQRVNWNNNEGDFTRCLRKVTKYLGPMAPGYCQNLHKRKFGKSNYKRDNG